MFNGEIMRIQTHDAVIFATKGNSTDDARLFLQQSWPRKTTKTCSTFVTCRNLRDSLYLYIFASVFFPFLFYCFSLGRCSEHRHFQRTRTATMRSAAAHVTARQSTSNQLAIIDINKVISIVNVHQNEKQRNVPLIENKNRYRGFVKNVMHHGNCLKSSYHFVE